MSPKEFKALNNTFLQELQKKLPDSDIKMTNHPFQGTLVGVSYEKGGNVFEIYQLNNDGNEASYKFIGQGQL